MISEGITKQQFIIQVLERDVKNIYRAQELIAKRNIYIEGKELKKKKRKGALIGEKTGRLLQSLENPDYIIQAQGEKLILSAGIVKHMRFIDMKKFGNRKIYNRQLWGILYNNSLRAILHEYGKNIRDVVREALEEAFQTSLHRDKVKDYGKAKGRTN